MRVDGSKIVNPGVYRERIQIQRKSVSGQNSTGEDVFTWVKVVDCAARVTSLQGVEIDEKAEQIWENALYRIEMHWFSGLDSAMRAVWQAAGGLKGLNITDISDTWGTRRLLILSARSLPDETTDVSWL